MKVTTVITDSFARATKKLRKKYPSIISDVERLQNDLRTNPTMGVLLKDNIYKIRLAIKSKGQGKSGGARVIAYHEILLQVTQHTIHLIAIYDKSDQTTISDAKIQNLLVQNGLVHNPHND